MFKFLKLYQLRILIITLLMPVVLFVFWREYRIRSIPDVGEPFDVEAFLKPYQDDQQNGIYKYQEALEHVVEVVETKKDGEQTLEIRMDHPLNRIVFTGANWKNASPYQQQILKLNPNTLSCFYQGTQKRFAIRDVPEDVRRILELDLDDSRDPFFYDNEPPIHFLGGYLTFLKASQLKEEGDLDGAWKYYLSLMELAVQRLHYGTGHYRDLTFYREEIYSLYRMFIGYFLAHKELSSAQLKRFSQDVETLIDSIPPRTVQVKWDYLLKRHSVGVPEQGTALDVWEQITMTMYEVSHYLWNEETYQKRLLAYKTSMQLQALKLKDSGQPVPGELNSYDESLEEHQQLRYELQLIRLFIALQIYHREQGQFPDHLTELIPEYLETIPRNSFNDSLPIEFERTSEGIQLGGDDNWWKRVFTPGTRFHRQPRRAEKWSAEKGYYHSDLY